MTRYDEIKKRVQGTTSSQNSPAAGNRQSSYEDIKSSFHPTYEAIKANPANYDDSDVDINTWFQTSYDDMQKAGSRLKAQNYSDWHNSEAVDLDKYRDGSYAVRAWINRHRGEIGDETADEALEQLDSQLEVIRSLREATASAGNYWSQWDSQEEYDAAVKASQQTQMTSSQIRQEIEEVTRQLEEEEAKENEQPTTRITNLWRPFINDEVKDDLKSDRIKELEAERDRLDSLYQQKKQYEASIPEKLREEHILAQKEGVPIIYALKPAEKIDTFIGQDGTEFTIDISKMLQEAVAGVSQAGETGEPAPTAFKELRFVLRENGYDYYRANGTGQLYRFRYNEDDDKDEFQLMMGLRTTQGVDPLVFKKAEEEGSGPSSDDPFEEYVYYQNRRVKQADYAKAAHELYQSPFFRYSNAIGKAIDDVNQLVPNAVKGIQKVYENSPFAPTDKEKEEPKDLLAALNAAKEAPEPTYGLQLYRNLPAAETFAGKAADFLGRLTVEAAETAYISLVTGGLGLGGKVQSLVSTRLAGKRGAQLLGRMAGTFVNNAAEDLLLDVTRGVAQGKSSKEIMRDYGESLFYDALTAGILEGVPELVRAARKSGKGVSEALGSLTEEAAEAAGNDMIAQYGSLEKAAQAIEESRLLQNFDFTGTADLMRRTGNTADAFDSVLPNTDVRGKMETAGNIPRSADDNVDAIIRDVFGYDNGKTRGDRFVINDHNGADYLDIREISTGADSVDRWGITNAKLDDLEDASLSNLDARKWYLRQETTIPGRIDKNLSLEDQAKQAFEWRNRIRTRARELMMDRKTAEGLNITDPNKTWEQMVQKAINDGHSGEGIYTAIIESSTHSRADVNKKFGLEGWKK